MKMDLETKGIGGRHRDNSHHFAAESEALDQIAKEVNRYDSRFFVGVGHETIPESNSFPDKLY